MSPSILLISDDPGRSAQVADELGRWFHVEQISLADAGEAECAPLFVLVDIDLTNGDSLMRTGPLLRSKFKSQDRIFLVGDKHSDTIQANALGASAVLRYPFNKNSLKKVLSKFLYSAPQTPTPVAVSTEEVLDDVLALQSDFYDAVRMKQPLPKDKVVACSEQMVSNLSENSIGSWLDVVKTYHSYTHRHCMIVSGIVVAFALQLGMRRADAEFLALGGLVHDIGKVRIPLSILDKPGKLTTEERELINLHPGYSAEILRMDGQFSEDVIDMALHHHEYLDGSGYPDGLSGDEISDPVRIMTIVDIFSALIDKRSYKEAMTGEESWQILRGMDGKLEMCLVEAFKPIALQIQSIEDATFQTAV